MIRNARNLRFFLYAPPRCTRHAYGCEIQERLAPPCRDHAELFQSVQFTQSKTASRAHRELPAVLSAPFYRVATGAPIALRVLPVEGLLNNFLGLVSDAQAVLQTAEPKRPAHK